MKRVTLRNTRIALSPMAMGTGTHGWNGRSDQTDLGLQGLADFLVAGYERGVNFWDAADQYGSHRHLAQALKRVPREEVVILTKTTAKSEASARDDLARFRRELGTDKIDMVLLHGLSSEDWPQTHVGAMAALAQAKDQGLVRAVGLSVHGLGALRAAAETDWVDVVLARINGCGQRMDGMPDEVVPLLERINAAGKDVLGMKILACGGYVDDVPGAIAWVFNLGPVQAITLGMTSLAQLEENVRIVEGVA